MARGWGAGMGEQMWQRGGADLLSWCRCVCADGGTAIYGWRDACREHRTLAWGMHVARAGRAGHSNGDERLTESRDESERAPRESVETIDASPRRLVEANAPMYRMYALGVVCGAACLCSLDGDVRAFAVRIA